MNKLKYLIISPQGYFLALYFLSINKHKYTLLITHSLVVSFFLLNWIVIEYINPEDKNYGSSPYLKCTPSRNKSNYCIQCKKMVLGIDHHCTWLNTCIGSKNYILFVTIVIIGTLQMGLQVVAFLNS